jgi:hypothetical protein
MPQSPYSQYLDDLITEKFGKRGHALKPAVRDEIRKDVSRQLNNLIMLSALT